MSMLAPPTRARKLWRLTLLGSALTAIVVAVHAPGPPAPPDQREHPYNVILIVSDSLRADHLQSYGYPKPTSPSIAHEARRSGIIYDHAYSHFSFTWPSLANLFTGLPFSALVGKGYFTEPTGREGLRWRGGLQSEVSTLAERLGEVGVRSYGVSGSPYITKATGFGQGFSRFYDWSRWRHHGREGDQPYVPAENLSKVAFDYLRELKGHDPWFLYLHYMDTHMAYHATSDDLAHFADAAYRRSDRVRGGAALSPDGKWLRWLIPGQDWLTPEDIDHLIAHYDAQIRRFDRAMKKLFAHLDQSGLRDTTVVVITSDHGESFYERGFWGHGFLSRREEQHVPLIVIFPPGEKEPRRVEFPVTTTDIFHTLLEHFGASGSHADPALPQVANLFEATPHADVAYTEGPGGTRIYRSNQFSFYSHRALHQRGYPLPADNGDYLFDIRSDPGEQHDLLAEGGAAAQRERDALISAGPSALSDQTVQDPMFKAKGKLREKLRALGYATDEG